MTKNDEIDARYAVWTQRFSKLENDIDQAKFELKTYNGDSVKFTTSINELKSRHKELTLDLDDIICDEEVEDFLNNGPGCLDTSI